MTNSPIYDQQPALNDYWKSIAGLTFLPGTSRAANSFARAPFLLGAIPKKRDPRYCPSMGTSRSERTNGRQAGGMSRRFRNVPS